MKYFFGLLLAWWLSEPYWGFIEIRLSAKTLSKAFASTKTWFSFGMDCAQETHLMGVGLNDPMQTVLKYIGCTGYACIDLKLTQI